MSATSHHDHDRAAVRAALQQRVTRFMASFAAGAPPAHLLREHFTGRDDDAICEYGPAFARDALPFLGEWRGYAGALDDDDDGDDDGDGDGAEQSGAEHADEAKEQTGQEQGVQARGTLLQYLSALGETLAPEAGDLDAASFAVDTERLTVSVVGRALFRALKSRQGWWETYTWRVVLRRREESGAEKSAAEGGKRNNAYRIARWEIFADPLSAWLAVRGELPDPL